MKKVVALVMAFIVVGLAFDMSCFETRADVTPVAYAETNYLLWTYLNTMFTATAGKQASDTTTNDSTKNYNLYRDFINFCNETSQNAQMVAKIDIATAKYGYIKMKEAIDAFSTDGTSALDEEVTEKVTNDFKVIDGGGNPSNNNDDNNNNDDDNLVFLGSASSSAFMTLVGKYLEDLYNGKRGDVSAEFLADKMPELYFNEENGYISDSYGYAYMSYRGDTVIDTNTYVNDWLVLDDKLHNIVFSDDNPVCPGRSDLYNKSAKDARLCIYIESYMYDDWAECLGLKASKKYSCIYICFLDSTGGISYQRAVPQYVLKHDESGVDFKLYSSLFHYIPELSLRNFGGCPVFSSYNDALKYLNTGSYSHALNYVVPKHTPQSWYDFKLAEIAKQLEKATKMLTQLPQITTDMLHGFAVGVTGATAGVGANTSPNAQEDAVKKAMEESAGETAKKYYQKTSKKSKEELEKEMQVTPSPTKTPTKKVEQTNATMMVDLHEFFPFCVPYDLIHLVKCFCAEPQTPKFDINLKLPYIGKIDTCLDLTMFNEAARILRILETIGFILSLVLVSRNLIRG